MNIPLSFTHNQHHRPEALCAADGLKRDPGNVSDINCTGDCGGEIPAAVAHFVRFSLSANTQRAYLSDLANFEAYGGTLPASPGMVAAYLADHADRLKIDTLLRRTIGIGKAHEARGLPNPIRSELVRATLRGIRRTRGSERREARPLLKENLGAIVDSLDTSLRGQRDRALLLLGFAGGFRRSELVGLDRCDVEAVREGLIVTLRRSKNDQFGEGRRIGIPYGRTRWCPVLALQAWLSASGNDDGPLFRAVSRHGRMGAKRLSGEAVSLIIRERALAAGFDPHRLSGHSLRAGLATSAAKAGVPSWRIRAQTGHASDAMLSRYIRSTELFLENAAGALL